MCVLHVLPICELVHDLKMLIEASRRMGCVLDKAHRQRELIYTYLQSTIQYCAILKASTLRNLSVVEYVGA